MKVAKTQRLTLSKVSIKDASFMMKLMNTPHWLKYIGDRGIKSIKDAENHIQKVILQSYNEHRFGFYKVELKDTLLPIGICGIIKRPYLKYPDIGFAFLPQFEGRGYGYESAMEVLELAKDSFEIMKIGAITLEMNTNSIKLIEKLGLTFEKKINPFDNDEELLLFAKIL